MRRGQSTTEYAVFAAVVVAALIAMSAYIRRAIQANLKVAEEQINAEALPPPQDGGPDVGGPGGGGSGGGGGGGGGGGPGGGNRGGGRGGFRRIH